MMWFKKTTEKQNKKELSLKKEQKEKLKAEGELAIDVFKTADSFVIRSAIAGITENDIELSMENDMLTISGERKEPDSSPNKKYSYQECYFGPFSRKIILPADIKASELEASLENGLLIIKAPLKGKH